MIKQISWSTYFSILIFFTVAYYLVIFILYYFPFIKKGLEDRLAGNGIRNININDVAGSSVFATPNIATPDEPLFALTQNLVRELEILIEKASFEKNGKEDLITSLQPILSAYPTLKGTPFIMAVNSYLIAQSQINCSITLSEDDLKVAWNGR